MLPLRVFVVSLLLPAGTLCISSHSPLDLFAYPAYAVKLNPASPISNTSAEAILAAAAGAKNVVDPTTKNVEDEEEEPRNDELQIQTNRKLDVLGLHDDAEASGGSAGHEHDQILKGPIKPYLLRSSGNGQAYLCSVPQHSIPSSSSSASNSNDKSGELVKNNTVRAPATEAEKEERRLKNEQDKKHAFESGLALLEPLKGSCLYLTQGWFTYAFCYGSEIRQFHAVKNTSPLGPPLIEDLTQEAYTLGLWSNRLTQDEGLVDVKKARALGSLREILASEDKSEENALEVMRGGDAKSAWRGDEDSIGDERRYLVQRWTGGTLCDKTGVERSIEVQFHCNSQSSDKIFLVRETAICEYVIVIHTPRLCGEPIFVGGSSSAADDAAEKKKKELNVIECRPVVRDELYAQYINAGNDQEHAGSARSLPEAEVPKTDHVSTPDGSKVAEQPGQQTGQQNTAAINPEEAVKDQQDARQHESDTKTDDPEQPQVEEFVLGSYVLAYDLETGKMTVDPDPAEVVKNELNSPSSNGANKDEREEPMSPKEAEAMEALLTEFRKSLEEMMQNVGGVLKNAKEDASTVQDTIKKVQQAYEAAANGPLPAGGQEQAAGVASPVGDGGKEGQQQQPHARKVDPLSRLTRTGAHNDREIAEKYLNGQLGLSAGKKKLHREQEGATVNHLHRQREARQHQHKLGTPQFRNLKRAFEQKWDDDESDNASSEGKSGEVDKAKNIPPAGAADAEAAGRHDEL